MSFQLTQADADSYVIAHEILARLGDKWSVLIIHLIDGEPIRFTSLKRKIDQVHPISARVLTRALKQLERDGLISRKAFAVVPPRVEYSLTRLGRRFLDFSTEIVDWARQYHAEFAAAREVFEARGRSRWDFAGPERAGSITLEHDVVKTGSA